VNTRLAPGSIGGAIRVGDPVHVDAATGSTAGVVARERVPC
jgi:hypothetical protein